MGSYMESSKALFLALFTLIAGVGIGIILGYFVMVEKVSMQQTDTYNLLKQDNWKDSDEIKMKILNSVDPDRIRENLREFSKEPHVAGTKRDEELAQYIQKTWKNHGFHESELVPYTVLLSHPDPQNPNMINIMGASDEVLHIIVPLEMPLREEDRTQHVTQGFHAYSPSGIAEGELVFANEGSEHDFEMLEQLDINITGKIVLVVEGLVERAIRKAKKRGAVGLLSYPDPSFYAKAGATKEDVYPNSTMLPGSGIFNTPIYSHSNFGDILTTGYPATEHAYRQWPENETTFTSIPSQPIGYTDAMKLLRLLDGPEIPSDWYISNPEFKNFRIGPGFLNSNHKKIRLVVNNQMKLTKIYNVIGTIKGSAEPDRYVIYGNHRDAWSFGAVDPSSGTAVLMELSRVFGKLLKEGWKPRRTIVFASWTAEEYGLIGSTEWVEEKLPKLHHRAIMYLNTDICVIGENFFPTASPNLASAIFEVAKMIPDPAGNYDNVYESMFNQTRLRQILEAHGVNATTEPLVADFFQAGVSSDHLPFTFFGNIPYMDVNWRREFSIMSSGPVYETYHTGYDTFYYMDKFVDPTYKFHRSCAQLSGLLIHYVADSKLVPLNMTSYSAVVDRLFESMKSLAHRGINLDPLMEAAKTLRNSVEAWYKTLETIDMTNPMIVRMLNDQVMQFERNTIFLRSKALLQESKGNFPSGGTDGFRNSLSTIFSSVNSLAFLKEEGSQNETEIEKYLQRIQSGVSDLSIIINQVSQSLQPFHVV